MMLNRMGSSLLLLIMIAGLSLLTPYQAIGQTKVITDKAAGEEVTKTFTAYIHTIKQTDGTTYVNVDPISWYQGEAADRIFKELEPEGYKELGGSPDGYYIVNNTEEHDSYAVKPDAEVLMQLYDRDGHPENADIRWNEPITLDKFVTVLGKGGLLDPASFPYHITVQDGQVVKIVQQYIP
ncbi:hypothetical protein [Paenibacillus caui]|uniref:hypothetical protein n=1 Tax=Paenibacillus caui TaxID=2873927 RepID=UPI001CA86414|nr:hypothetical protein [Paenibacillus caui]